MLRSGWSRIQGSISSSTLARFYPQTGKMGDVINDRSDSQLFQPLIIANGKIKLQHRVIHAPLTRNRGTPFNPTSTPENPNRHWIPNDLIAKYYAERATDGGLLISEGIPPSLEV